jgi:hypothetical protein
MEHWAGALLGLVAALIVFAVFVWVARVLHERDRDEALTKLREAVDGPEPGDPLAVGRLLYESLAEVVTVDFEKEPDVRKLTRELLAKAEPYADPEN